MGAVERDQTWAAIWNVAARMNRRYTETALRVRPARHMSIRNWTVTEGLEAVDNWTEVFEPVRRRRLLRRWRWTEIQPVAEAASKVGRFIRDRPDLPNRDSE